MTPFNSLGNAYFQYLQEANALHLSARAKYLQLTKLLQSKGVKFPDIKRFLMNQAKKSGLYRKTWYNEKKGELDYPQVSKITHLAWYASVTNYMSWLKSNFKDYGVPADKKPKAVKTTSKVVVRKDAQGNVKKAQVIKKNGVTEDKEVDSIIEELSQDQLMSIVSENWHLLGKFCQSKGATEEFNLLMDALGYEEETLEV